MPQIVRLGRLVAVVLLCVINAGALSSPLETTVESKIHEAEISRGKQLFDVISTVAADNSHTWSDADFIAYPLGTGNAGTDATYLQNGDLVFESQQPLVTADECKAIIEEARATIAQGLIGEADKQNSETSDQARILTNSQLGEARLSQMPPARLQWLQETLQKRFLPLLEDRFGVGNLILYDGLVLGHQAPSRSQPIHRDASLLTLNVALSSLDEFDGGGTYIEALDQTLKINQGHLLCHAGGVMHAGIGISSGERWVLVLFVLAEKQPQIARRCHAQALDYLEDKETWDEAERVLQIGLSAAPNDHLLHNTMGRLHVQRGEMRSAFRNFQQADAAYPICQKAMVSMGQVLVEQRRPRAALRRFDTVLERINSRDLEPDAMMSLKSLAWAARRDAARCALICADQLARKPPALLDHAWSRHHLPVAIERMKTCLVAAPSEPNLNGMLDHAEFLLAQIEK
jgi:tetratricopeptide (TPR) repeat protein